MLPTTCLSNSKSVQYVLFGIILMVDSIDYACSCCIRRCTLTVISSSMFITRLCIVVSRLFLHIETNYESIPRVRDESLKPSSPVFALKFDLLLPVVYVFLLLFSAAGPVVQLRFLSS